MMKRKRIGKKIIEPIRTTKSGKKENGVTDLGCMAMSAIHNQHTPLTKKKFHDTEKSLNTTEGMNELRVDRHWQGLIRE